VIYASRDTRPVLSEIEGDVILGGNCGFVNCYGEMCECSGFDIFPIY